MPADLIGKRWPAGWTQPADPERIGGLPVMPPGPLDAGVLAVAEAEGNGFVYLAHGPAGLSGRFQLGASFFPRWALGRDRDMPAVSFGFGPPQPRRVARWRAVLARARELAARWPGW